MILKTNAKFMSMHRPKEFIVGCEFRSMSFGERFTAIRWQRSKNNSMAACSQSWSMSATCGDHERFNMLGMQSHKQQETVTIRH